MEKLINQIPKEKLFTIDKVTGEKNFAGFCLRYSTKSKKWICGYGRNFSKSEVNRGLVVEANDPVEALAFFVELLNK